MNSPPAEAQNELIHVQNYSGEWQNPWHPKLPWKTQQNGREPGFLNSHLRKPGTEGLGSAPLHPQRERKNWTQRSSCTVYNAAVSRCDGFQAPILGSKNLQIFATQKCTTKVRLETSLHILQVFSCLRFCPISIFGTDPGRRKKWNKNILAKHWQRKETSFSTYHIIWTDLLLFWHIQLERNSTQIYL